MAALDTFTTKAVIMVGGPSKGTRFRPLSLEVPKPLFPIAGTPVLENHVKACAKLPNLKEILLLGFYPAKDFEEYTRGASKRFNVPFKYLDEGASLGTAGGMYKFKDEILEGSPHGFFVLHCDAVCSFPLEEILEFHKSHGKLCTVLATSVPDDTAHNFGQLVENDKTHEALHYAEKPQTFVSSLASCGVYLFSPGIFDALAQAAEKAASRKKESAIPYDLRRSSDRLDHGIPLSLEKNVLKNLPSQHQMYVYHISERFIQLKEAGMALNCANFLLRELRQTNPELLSKNGDGRTASQIIGNVLIHPTAIIDPTAKLGDNVCIGANVHIGRGVRVVDSIILDGAEIKDHACILHSIIGWGSIVGQWTRVEGNPNYNATSRDTSVKSCGVTIFGAGVKAAPEIIIRNSIVLPHKELSQNYADEILL